MSRKAYRKADTLSLPRRMHEMGLPHWLNRYQMPS